MYSVFKQSEFVSDWCAKCRRPPIQGALVETMGCSQPVLPSFPVRRDKGAKGRCRLISANLICAVCFLFYMGCTLIEITNKTGLNWVHYIVVCFFSSVSCDISLSLSFLFGDWCSSNRHHTENIWGQCLMMAYIYFLVIAAARSLEPLQYFQQLMLLGVCRRWFKKGVCQHDEL